MKGLLTPVNLRVVIVDDEALARQELQYLLESAGGVEVVAIGCNGIQAVELIRTHQPDLVFLDVQMPGLDGFGVLKKLLEKKTPLPQVVFATAYDQYAVRAFEVNAVDYLLKPFDRVRVNKTLEKARMRVPAKDVTSNSDTATKLDALLKLIEQGVQPPPAVKAGANKIVVRAMGRLLLADQKDICFASIEDGTISVTTASVTGESNCRTLEELMDQLDPDTFWRAHRSHIVNLQHIREVVPWFKSSYQLRMDDPKKTELPVSRNQTRRLRELFNL